MSVAAISIEKLTYWRGGKWVKCDQGSDAIIRTHFDQLIISADNKILESLNMTGKIKGFFKGDVLILVISTGFEIRKMKFKVKGDIDQSLEVFGKYFPIAKHRSGENTGSFTSKYRNVEEVMKCAIKSMEDGDKSLQLPDNYTNFVKLCLLDPTFPQFVQETQNILDRL